MKTTYIAEMHGTYQEAIEYEKMLKNKYKDVKNVRCPWRSDGYGTYIFSYKH